MLGTFLNLHNVYLTLLILYRFSSISSFHKPTCRAVVTTFLIVRGSFLITFSFPAIVKHMPSFTKIVTSFWQIYDLFSYEHFVGYGLDSSCSATSPKVIVQRAVCLVPQLAEPVHSDEPFGTLSFFGGRHHFLYPALT